MHSIIITINHHSKNYEIQLMPQNIFNISLPNLTKNGTPSSNLKQHDDTICNCTKI